MSNHWDWSPYLAGGGTRPDAMSGLDRSFTGALQRMFAEAPPEIQAQLRINSAYRSPELQAQLFADAVQQYGSESAARRWVAPPGNSRHNAGRAADLGYLDGSAREYAQANAARYGLQFPMDWEPWHIELAGAGGGRVPLDGASQPAPQQNALAALSEAPQAAPGAATNRLAQLQAVRPQINQLNVADFLTRPNQNQNILSMMPGAY
jgi:D-alanyl-D-alanine carboxypeptidase